MKGVTCSPDNYRQVSITSVVTMESIVNDVIVAHMVKQASDGKGFREGMRPATKGNSVS